MDRFLSLRVWEFSMPIAPRSPCNEPRCPRKAETRGKCREHARLAQQRYDGERGSSAERGYGGRWPAIRAAFLAAHPVCCVEGCGATSTVPDHYPTSVRQGTELGWTWDQIHDVTNLRAMCKKHHDSRTAKDQGWGRSGSSRYVTQRNGLRKPTSWESMG